MLDVYDQLDDLLDEEIEPIKPKTTKYAVFTTAISIIAAIGLSFATLGAGSLLPWQYIPGAKLPHANTTEIIPVVKGSPSTAQNVLTKVIEDSPENIENMTPAALGPSFAHTLPGMKSCEGMTPVPPVVTAARGWSGGNWIAPHGVTLTINAYQAGTGHDAFQQLKEGNCAGLKVTEDAGDTVRGTIRNGNEVTEFYAWRQSDVISSITATNRGIPSSLLERTRTRLKEQLTPVCTNIDEQEDTSTRNPYYSKDEYTGWRKPETVRPSVEVPVKVDQPYVNPMPYVFIPEQPEFPFYPKELPQEVKEPTPPSVPTYPATEETIYPQFKDDKGPGCGWAFTGLQEPLFDASKANTERNEMIKTSQNRMSQGFDQYNVSVSEWRTSWEQFQKDETAFRNYAAEVSNVASQWDAQRGLQQEYKTNLANYENAVKSHDSFIQRQKTAAADYQTALETCSRYENAEPVPSTTVVTPKPYPTTTVVTPPPRVVYPEPTQSPEPSVMPSQSPSPSASPLPSPSAPSSPITIQPEPYETTVMVTPEPYETTVMVKPQAPIPCPPSRPSILDQNPPSVPDKPTPPPDPRPVGER